MDNNEKNINMNSSINLKLNDENLDVDDISLNTITSVFKEREKYIIIALTGKVGSGCTQVSNIFKQPFKDMNLIHESPNHSGFEDDQKRVLRILFRFYKKHAREFYIIKVRDVITSFLLEDNAWEERIGSYSDDILNDFIKRRDENDICKDHSSCSGRTTKTVLNNLKRYNNSVFCKKSTKKPKQNEDINDYIKQVLPLLSECVRNKLSNNFTFFFQEFGNELRFFGTLDPSKRKSSLTNAINICDPYNDDESTLYHNTMFTIAKRINQIIKYIQRPDNSNRKKQIAVVIDSMKNMYESNYLRDRYSAYYLIAISRDEEIRNKYLLSNHRKNLTQDNIDIIDLNERPAVASKKLSKFAELFVEEFKNSENYDVLKNYLNSICFKDQKELFEYCINLEKQNAIKSLIDSFENNKLASFFDDFSLGIKRQYKNSGLSIALCKYYISILKYPLRVFLYTNDLYSFYLQDVETCIQNSDILLTNNEDNAGPKNDLKMNIVRYVSLMMHPGLIKPTQIERCMQIAYTAKVNSGCISRQVGAVVTDKDYNILSLGWNDVPCGQTPCAYRNLIDLARQNDKPAYSNYEWRKDSPFHNFIDRYNFSNVSSDSKVLDGLPASFCFKKLNENVTGEKNPMNARSMHGEEKALLQCDQQRVKGGYLFTTSSPCEMCAKNAKEHRISKIYYIEPYPGISQSHICSSGDNRAELILFEGAIGRAYTQLYTPILPYKDELTIRGFPQNFKKTK